MKFRKLFWILMAVAVCLLIGLSGASQQSAEVLVGEWEAYAMVDTTGYEIQWTFADTSFTWRVYELTEGGMSLAASATGTWMIEGLILITRYEDGAVEMFQISYTEDRQKVSLQFDPRTYYILYRKPE